MVIVFGPERREGSIRGSYRSGRQVVEETYTSQVTTDDPEITRDELINHEDAPVCGRTTSPSELGVCRSFSFERDPECATLWHLTTEYTSDPAANNQNSDPGSPPEEWVPIWEANLEPYEEVVIFDVDGRPIVNGANDPPDTALTIQKDLIRWDFYQFEPPGITDVQIAQLNNKINSEPFRGFAKETLLLKVRKSSLGFYFGRYLRNTEYSVLWKPDNWHTRIANAGQSFVYRITTNDYRCPYRYKDNPEQVITGPLGSKDYTIEELASPTDQYNFLATGGGIPTGGIERLVDSDYTTAVALPTNEPKLYFIEYRMYQSIDFNLYLR